MSDTAFRAGDKVKIISSVLSPGDLAVTGLSINGYGYIVKLNPLSDITTPSYAVSPITTHADSYRNGVDGWYFSAHRLQRAFQYTADQWNIDQMIDIHDIKFGDYLVIKTHSPSWVSESAMKSYGWHLDTPYEVVRVSLRNGYVDLKKKSSEGFSFYHVSQLAYPFSYTVEEWNIDQMIDTKNITVGDMVTIISATPSWASKSDMFAYGGFSLGKSYRVEKMVPAVRASGASDTMIYLKSSENGDRYYFWSEQLVRPYTVSEWTIDQG